MCAGDVGLRAAQRAIASNWVVAYRRYVVNASSAARRHGPATAARLPGLLTQQTPRGFYVRPDVVRYSGDSTGYLGGKDGDPNGEDFDFGTFPWGFWNTRHAGGVGVAWLNDCEPSCADGTFEAYRANVSVYRVRNHHFTRLLIKFTYHGRHITDLRKLQRFGNSYGWGIIRQTGF